MDFQEQNLHSIDGSNQTSLIPSLDDPLQNDFSQNSQIGETHSIESLIEEAASQIADGLDDTIPEIPEELLLGDASGDSGLDQQDLQSLLGQLRGSYQPHLDLDEDGRLSVFDVLNLGGLIAANTDFNAPTLTVDLLNDTGTVGDNLTSDPTLGGALTDVDGSKITRFTGSVDGGDAVDLRGIINEDGSFSLNRSRLEIINQGSLTEGFHTVSLFAKDEWNNSVQQEVTITLDETPPDEPTLNLVDASDSGNSNSDNITNDNTPTLEITAEAGSTVKLLQDGTEIAEITANSEGKAEFTSDLLVDGIYDFTAAATDAAGNTSNFSSPLTVTIDTEDEDTTPPETPIVNLVDSSDSGESDSDNVTSDSTPTLEITAEVDSTVDLLQDGTLVATVTADSTGKAQFTLESLADGTYEFTATATDAAGNISDLSASLTIEIDTTAPDAPTLGLDPAFDSEPLGDEETTFEIVTLVGQTAPDKQVVLEQTGAQTTSDSEGVFQFAGISLAIGENIFTVRATDAAGNVSENSQTITRIEAGDITPPEVPTVGLVASSDSGDSNSDNITNDETPTLEITAEAESTVNLLQDGTSIATVTADVTGKAQFTLESLADGAYEFTATATDAAGNTSNLSSVLSVSIDTAAPTAGIPGSLTEGTSTLDVSYNETVNSAGFDSGNYSLTIVGGDNDGESVAISEVLKISDTVARLTLAEPLSAGAGYRLALGTAIADLAGNAIDQNTSIDFSTEPPTVEIAPINGEEMVSLTRKTVVNFETEVDPATVNDETFYLIANGNRVAGRVEVSSTNRFATFIPDSILPASTEVRIVLDGDDIKTPNGTAFDVDLDGIAGGTLTADFTTLPTVQIEGTTVFGFVFDSYNRNEDGSNVPVVGATIRVDGIPGLEAVTDETGFFELVNVPAPEFFVFIDGSTVTNAPEATQYASLGKRFHSVPGERIQLTTEGETFDIFLPPVVLDDAQALSATEMTEVGFGEGALELLEEQLPEVDASVWEQVKVIFEPGAAVDDGGSVATQAIIVPVEPNRLPAPIPPGLDPGLVISVQAGGDNGFNREEDGGSTFFDRPPAIQFPNLDNLPPGSKATIWSFDHEAGFWVTVGTGTVSEDGEVITSDPGVGLLAPGWHFVSPPLNWTGSGGEPEGNEPVNEESDPEVFVNLFKAGDTDTLFFTFTPPSGPGKSPGNHELPQGDKEPTKVVEIAVDGLFFDEFYDNEGDEGLKTETFTLRPGDEAVNRSAILRTLEDIQEKANGTTGGILGFFTSPKPFENDVIYGAKITVVETTTLADGSTSKSTRIILPYLYVDQSDDKPEDGVLEFADTVVDGAVRFERKVELKTTDAPSAFFEFEGAAAGDYSDLINKIGFDPQASGDRSANLKVRVTVDGDQHTSSNSIQVKGQGVEKQTVFINKAGLRNALDSVNVQYRLISDYGLLQGGEDFTLTLDTETTGNINHNASAADIETALEALSNVSPGDVSVRLLESEGILSTTNTFEIEFLGGLDGTSLAFSGTSTPGGATLTVVSSVSQAEWSLIDSSLQTIANNVETRVTNLFSAFSNGVEVKDSPGTHTITINWDRTDVFGLLGHSKPDPTDDGIDNAEAIRDVVNDYKKYTEVVQNFILDKAVNQSLNTNVEVYVDSPVEIVNLNGQANPLQALVNTLAKTAAHEAGHTLGGRHTHKVIGGTTFEVTVNGVQGRTDLLFSGFDFAGNLAFREFLTANILQLALNLGWTQEQGQRALGNYIQHYQTRSTGFDAIDDEPEPDEELLPIDGALLAIADENNFLLPQSFDLGSVITDGAGGEQVTTNLSFINIGNEDLVIEQVLLDDAFNAFSITPIAPDTVIASEESIDFAITFDPQAAGDIAANLFIQSNDVASPLIDLDLSGFGLNPNPVFELSLLNDNNNFGGLAVDQANSVQDFLTITNQGAAELVFTPTIVDGELDFGLGGFENVEQTLAFGESLVIPVTFNPTTTGLLPGTVQFTTNDPNLGTFSQGIVGTGIPDGPVEFDWGNDFVVVEYNGFVERTISNNAGDFMFEIPTFTEYDISIFDPDSGLIATGGGFTGPAAAFTDLTTSLAFAPSTAIDSDFDGLPDDIEFAIGSALNKIDTDDDTLSDFVEIENGLDPLGGQGFPTGIIASLDLLGEANAVVVEASSEPGRDQVAYVATGSHGLAIVDASEFSNPNILGQLNLSDDAN